MTAITNENQYAVTLRQRESFATTLAELIAHIDSSDGPCQVCELERASIEGVLADLDAELRAYEAATGRPLPPPPADGAGP